MTSQGRHAGTHDLIAKAEEDLKAHFVRFNEMVEEEIGRRTAGDRGQ